MMRGCHHQFFNIVIIKCLHSLDSSAATVLAAEVIYGHSLDVTEFCHCDDCIFSRNHVFHRNVICVKSDCCSSVVTVFFGNCKDFFTDHAKKCVSVCQNCF